MPSKPVSSSFLPLVRISRRGAHRLQEGHVWVYRSDLISPNAVSAGAMVGVTDERGKLLGTALYSGSSQIAIRMISRHLIDNLPGLLRERIQAAISYRERIVRDTDAYRLVFSEADFLPGLIVDRYNDLLSVQVLTQAMDAEPVRHVIVSELRERLKPESIAERVDPRIRDLEQLPARTSGLIQGEKSSTIISMNGVRFHYEALEGQKTGAFLDQRERLTGRRIDYPCTHVRDVRGFPVALFAGHASQVHCPIGQFRSRLRGRFVDARATLRARSS